MRLTLWYVAAMVIVLGVYVFGVYTFVSRNVSDSLDERLRADFYWAAATVDEGPDGLIMPFPQIDLLLEEESPWVQVWSADGTQLLLMNEEARRRPLPEAQLLAEQGEDMIESLPTDRRAHPRSQSAQLHRRSAGDDSGRAIGSRDAAGTARAVADSRSSACRSAS